MITPDYKVLQEENRRLKHLIYQFKNLLNAIPDPVFMKDENLRWIYGNSVILNLYNIDMDNYIGKTEDQLLPEALVHSSMESDRKAIAKGMISKSEERLRDPQGRLRFYEVFKVPSYDPQSGAFTGLIGIGRDITERKETLETLESENERRKEYEVSLNDMARILEEEVIRRTTELEDAKEAAVALSYTDMLTGINNRRAYFEKSSIVDINARSSDCGYALLIFDIDHFKHINDTYGHGVGDQVLFTFADTLKKHLRITDIEGRIGGEEFAVTLVNTTLEDARKIAEKLKIVISEIVIKGYESIKLKVSIGIAVFHPAIASFKAVLSKADEALYRAKASGRNCICVYADV